jgi:hypothetical protein
LAGDGSDQEEAVEIVVFAGLSCALLGADGMVRAIRNRNNRALPGVQGP